MLLLVIRALYAVVCAGAIAAFVTSDERLLPEFVANHRLMTFSIFLGVSQAVTAVDALVRRKRVDVVTAIYFGLLIGVLLSFLLMYALGPILMSLGLKEWHGIATAMSMLMLSYLSISLLLQTKDDFRFVIPYVEFVRDLKGGRPLILDSSALIDGRIAEVVETKILDAKMVVPSFVLKEVQDIADSQDKGRRTRGRRGLEVLTRMRAMPHAEVEMFEVDNHDAKGMSVDQRLVKLALELGGRIVTGDFNLNKVASVQGVDVINLNDVASALRPRFLPGDPLLVKVAKVGEGAGQGIGYLDDGTMVVVEQGNTLIGQDVETTVTSVLQSSAGRMIFARPAGVEAAPGNTTDHRRHRT